MVYKAIGIMSGSALDGLDIVYVHFHETGGKWAWELQQAVTWEYTPEWKDRLQNAVSPTFLNLPKLVFCQAVDLQGTPVNAYNDIGRQRLCDLRRQVQFCRCVVIPSYLHGTFIISDQDQM